MPGRLKGGPPLQGGGPSPLNKRFAGDIYSGRRTLKEIMTEAEADFLRRAIDMYGSVQKVSEVFKVDRSTIFRKLKAAGANAEKQEN